LGYSNNRRIKKKATRLLDRIWFTGLRGKFETFGLPSVRHGDLATMQSLRLKEQNGIYKIKSVTKTFGMNGFKQDIELDVKVTGMEDLSVNSNLI